MRHLKGIPAFITPCGLGKDCLKTIAGVHHVISKDKYTSKNRYKTARLVLIAI